MGHKLNFLLIETVEGLEDNFSSLIILLESSKQDDGILGFNEKLRVEDVENYKQSLVNQVASNSMKILIALDSKKVILCCMLKGSHQQTTSHIYDLQKGLIHPDYRSKGLLQQAFANIANVAKENNVELLTLDVREGTPAHKLWEKVGFTTFGILNDYSRYQGESYKGHFMNISVNALSENFFRR
jgi:ribosomal protein S18 acetylase RimI-like enzyme